jgi:tetratricopeptide (TPR) repeat protein
MADDVVLQEAVDALRDGNKARARELLTELIKNDQNNVEYWVWLSGAMETPKEKIYCLQTAFKLDPENVSARRGLTLLGALPADENVPPFSMNRPRLWEQDLLLAHEKPKLKGWAAVKASPVFRLAIVILIIGAIGSGIGFGWVIPAIQERNERPPTATFGPSPTFTLTVTAQGGRPQTSVTGTPLGIAADLGISYSPTPRYVEIERAPETTDYILQFNRAYESGDLDAAIVALNNIIEAKPDNFYAYYYLGEVYRLRRDVGSAQLNYNQAISKNEAFAPAYVGLARIRLLNDPNANVLPILDQAVEYDPEYGEAYIERSRVKLRDNDIVGAIEDLGEANKRLPGSPLVFYYLAQVRLQEGDYEAALLSAQQANQLDLTHLPTYLLLGRINAKLGNDAAAIENLDIYMKYAPEDAALYLELGKLQYELGNYNEAVEAMTDALKIDRGLREAYLYRFLSNIELGDGAAADEDLDFALNAYPNSFEANLGLVRAHLLNGRNGSALVDLDLTLQLAQTDEQKALAYYWAAIVHEERDEKVEAADYWELLLNLPEEAMTAEMRQAAEEHLSDGSSAATPTRSPTPARTPSPTQTPTPTRTPSS